MCQFAATSECNQMDFEKFILFYKVTICQSGRCIKAYENKGALAAATQHCILFYQIHLILSSYQLRCSITPKVNVKVFILCVVYNQYFV